MKRVLLTVLFLSSFNSWAGESDPEKFIVKLTSQRDHEEIRYEGSGILVQYQKSVYVLTSEHVTLHDNEDGTHIEYQLDGKARQKLTYISSDWGMGLALLKAPAAIASEDLPRVEEMAKTPSPQVDEPAISAGFPVKSVSMVVDVDGSVSSTTNVSMILADVDKMLEIKGAHGEFGMSGGAVLNHDLAPIGVLSHETPDPQNKILYAVPISQAAQWAIRFITDPNAKPRLVRASSDFKWNQGQRVRNGRLIMDWYSGSSEKDPAYVEMGWDDTLQKLGLNPPTDAYPTDLMNRATRRISAFLENGHDTGFYARARVDRFRPRDFFRYQEMKRISSFVEFFRSLKDPALKPLAGFNRQGSQPWSWYSDQYCAASKAVDYATYFSVGGKLYDALKAVADLAGCTALDSWGMDFQTRYPVEALNRDDIEWILNDPQFKSDWASLQATSTESYKKVREALKTIEDIVAELNI